MKYLKMVAILQYLKLWATFKYKKDPVYFYCKYNKDNILLKVSLSFTPFNTPHSNLNFEKVLNGIFLFLLFLNY